METLFTELRQVFQDEYIHLGKQVLGASKLLGLSITI